MSVLRCFVLLMVVLCAPVRSAIAVSLMNGSVLSMNGLNLTVSNCTLILAGWQQTSCAAGNLSLQAVSGGRGTVSYQIAGNGGGANGTNIFSAVGGGSHNSGLYQLSFTLGVATNQPGSTVSSANLTTYGSDNYGCWRYCDSTVTTSQSFSVAAGGGNLKADLLSAPAASLILAKASAFTINETVTMNSFGPEQYAEHHDKETIVLSSVRQTFATAPEPATITLLLVGIGGLAVVRRRRC